MRYSPVGAVPQHRSSPPLLCDIFDKVVEDVACSEVFAYIVCRRTIAKYACAGLFGAPDLRGLLPNHLREMRRLRITRVVILNFNYPVADHFFDTISTSTSGQVFPYAAELATRVLKDTIIRPLLSKAFELQGVGQRLRVVLSARVIVELEILRSIARHISTVVLLRGRRLRLRRWLRFRRWIRFGRRRWRWRRLSLRFRVWFWCRSRFWGGGWIREDFQRRECRWLGVYWGVYWDVEDMDCGSLGC